MARIISRYRPSVFRVFLSCPIVDADIAEVEEWHHQTVSDKNKSLKYYGNLSNQTKEYRR